jgi:hypothetical protein
MLLRERTRPGPSLPDCLAMRNTPTFIVILSLIVVAMFALIFSGVP